MSWSEEQRRLDQLEVLPVQPRLQAGAPPAKDLKPNKKEK